MKIDPKIIIVIEKYSELIKLVELAKTLDVKPIIGLRVKMMVKGRGKWEHSSGERAKFGLSIAEILNAVAYLEAVGLIGHNRKLNRSENEGGAAHYVQCTTFGKTYLFRNVMLGINIAAACTLLAFANVSTVSELFYVAAWASLSIINIMTALIGRALFYNLVIPTTMPGAFFWKNKGFEQHARDIGLADNPACGVAPLAH